MSLTPLWTREEIIKRISKNKIGKNFFYTLVKQGLPVTKKGGRWFAFAEDIDRFLREDSAPYEEEGQPKKPL